MTKPTQAVATQTDKGIEFVPFGADSSIKLSLTIIKHYVCIPTKSGKICSDRDAMRFMMLCRSRGLNPFEGDCFLQGYDGKNGPEFSLITAHQAFLKRAELHPEFDGLESGVIAKAADGSVQDRVGDFLLEEDELLGAWATVHFKTRKYPVKERLNLTAFNKGYGRWEVDPAGMIVKCFDEDTELLTSLGFEKFSRAEGKVIQVTEHGLEETEAVPFVQNYSGPMIRYESDDLNFCVTPNHDMVTTSGKVEAGAMFEQARMRPKFWIPRIVNTGQPDVSISDRNIKLTAAFIACGTRNIEDARTFVITVSRPKKIDFLQNLEPITEHPKLCAGNKAELSSGRTITTKSDQTTFRFLSKDLSGICDQRKCFNPAIILQMSQRQARLLVETLIAFDGNVVKATSVKRFYQTRSDILGGFELAAVQAGLSVSNRKQWSNRAANIALTISERDAILVRRFGRELAGRSKPNAVSHANYASLEQTPNVSGRVWCVTVPSGVIVVRRNGFSHICGNCAESSSLRRAFPTKLGGMYLKDELDVKSEFPTVEMPPASVTEPATDADVIVETSPQAQEQPQHGQQQENSPQEQLASLVEKAGFTFNDLQAWGEQSGNIDGASSIPEYAAIPTVVAQRLLRAKTGLLDGMTRIKRTAQGTK